MGPSASVAMVRSVDDWEPSFAYHATVSSPRARPLRRRIAVAVHVGREDGEGVVRESDDDVPLDWDPSFSSYHATSGDRVVVLGPREHVREHVQRRLPHDVATHARRLDATTPCEQHPLQQSRHQRRAARPRPPTPPAATGPPRRPVPAQGLACTGPTTGDGLGHRSHTKSCRSTLPVQDICTLVYTGGLRAPPLVLSDASAGEDAAHPWQLPLARPSGRARSPRILFVFHPAPG